MSSDWFLYLIRCADRSLYTGITTDVDRRFAEHCAQGTLCAKYLRGRGPLVLVFQVRVGTRSEASRLEVRVKRLSKARKEAMVIGEISLEELGVRSRDGLGGAKAQDKGPPGVCGTRVTHE